MTKLKLSLAAIAASLILPALPAGAATPCSTHDAITKQLSSRYKEARQGIGLTSQTTVIELFVGDEGTWTLLATDTKGRTCVIGSGEGWEDQPKVLAGLES
jgi:hypothetical protein